MADNENPDYVPNAANSIWVHEPLPYIVRVRSTLTDDASPTTREFNVIAYSVMEAYMQAVIEAGGIGLDDMKHKVESVWPSVAHFKAWVLAAAFSKTLKEQK
jgi:hypothetical protein